MKAHFIRATMWLALSCTAWVAPASASPFTGLYVFGDSLSDVGNVFLGSGGTIPKPPYFAGRFSNGPIWVDDLAAKLGLGPILPSLAGGTDFAFGSAVTGPAVPGVTTAVPNLQQQASLFTFATGGHASPSALYAVWIGSNDVFTALDDLLASTVTMRQAAADLVTAAQTEAGVVHALAGEGAKTFLIPLVPDIGKTPDVTDFPALSPVATGLTQTYNTALVAAIGALTAGDGISVRYVDTFGLVDAAVSDPAAFGLTNATDRCYVGPLTGGGTVCATPNTYLFWDGQHPTAAGHAEIADLAAAALPEPPAALVLLAGICGMLALRAYRTPTA